MTRNELEARLTELSGQGPKADQAIHHFLSLADCDTHRAQVLAAVENGIRVARCMAEIARAQKGAA